MNRDLLKQTIKASIKETTNLLELNQSIVTLTNAIGTEEYPQYRVVLSIKEKIPISELQNTLLPLKQSLHKNLKTKTNQAIIINIGYYYEKYQELVFHIIEVPEHLQTKVMAFYYKSSQEPSLVLIEN